SGFRRGGCGSPGKRLRCCCGTKRGVLSELIDPRSNGRCLSSTRIRRDLVGKRSKSYRFSLFGGQYSCTVLTSATECGNRTDRYGETSCRSGRGSGKCGLA